MNEHTSTAIWGSFASISFAAAVIALVFFVSSANTLAHEQGTQRIESCVDAGGTWIYSGCIGN